MVTQRKVQEKLNFNYGSVVILDHAQLNSRKI